MASTYSQLKIELIGTGEQSGTWGTTTNTNLGTAIEEAITGSDDVAFSSADVTLTLTNTNTSQTARNLRLNLTGTSGGARNLTVPNIEKFYIITNGLANDVTVKNTTGSTYTIPAGTTAQVYSTGTGVNGAITFFEGSLLSSGAVILGGAINSTPIGALSASTGEFTTLDASSLTLTTPLAVTEGGTGVTTSTGTGNVVLSTSPTLTTPSISSPSISNATLTTPILGTPQSGTLTNCTGLPLTTGVTGTLPVTSGGTGVTTSTGTGNVVLSASPTLTGSPIAPTQTAGDNSTKIATTQYVATAITNATGSLGTMATQNANNVSITGGTITGITDLAVADGGTGASSITANSVILGNGSSALSGNLVAPGTSGNVLKSNGTTWTSSAPAISSWNVQNVGTTVANGATGSYTIPANCIMVMGSNYHGMGSNVGSRVNVQIKNSGGTVLYDYPLTGGNENNGTDGGSGMSTRSAWTVAIPAAAAGGSLTFYRASGSSGSWNVTVNQYVASA